MCAVSAVGDNWTITFPNRYPGIFEPLGPPLNPPFTPGVPGIAFNPQFATQADIIALRAEIAELRELLIAAKKFDEATGQADCEMEEKVALIKQIAKFVGVDMEKVFGNDR